MLTGGLYRPLAKRLPEQRLLATGTTLMLFGLAAVGLVAWGVMSRGEVAEAGSPWRVAFYAAAALAVSGFAFVNPSVSALISRRADADRQGEVLGVNQSFASLARILGPLVGLSLFSLHPSHVLPYATAVLVLLAVAVIQPRLRQMAASHPG
jgi:MFS transporter, DHA1 family, tetracycline resistance protein